MSVANLFPDIWAFVRLVVSVLAASGLAVWIFKTFGEKWLSAKFNERLESYRHAQQKELERLKFNINALMDRTTKLHQYEFDVLPQLWALLNEAFAETQFLISRLQTTPDLDSMGDSQLSEFMASCSLAQWQKIELIKMPQKTSEYQKMMFWHKLHKAQSKYSEFNDYYIKNGIFIQKDMKAKFDEISGMIIEAIGEKEFEERYPQPREGRFAKCDCLWEHGPPKLAAIGEMVQDRLWNARTLDG